MMRRIAELRDAGVIDLTALPAPTSKTNQQGLYLCAISATQCNLLCQTD
jgi:hypothetical protein